MAKPQVLIYATGGTIAGAAASSSATGAYSSGVLSVDQLLEAVPKIKEFAEVKGTQFTNVGSPDINSSHLIHMAQQIHQDLETTEAVGAVITHGTDTLEETAFCLDLTVLSRKPVVVVGAMRPSTALSADGPMNLLQAVRLAISKDAHGRGTMVVMNDRICSARHVTKTNANRMDSFLCGDAGQLGTFENSEPIFFWTAQRPNGWWAFDISGLDPKKGLPKVNILYGHLEAGDELIEASLDAGAKGIVLAGMGAGCWTTDGGHTIKEIMKERGDFPLIASYRTCYGYVDGTDGIYGLDKLAIGSGYLNPAKSRILLQLCLAQNRTLPFIRHVFQAHKKK